MVGTTSMQMHAECVRAANTYGYGVRSKNKNKKNKKKGKQKGKKKEQPRAAGAPDLGRSLLPASAGPRRRAAGLQPMDSELYRGGQIQRAHVLSLTALVCRTCLCFVRRLGWTHQTGGGRGGGGKKRGGGEAGGGGTIAMTRSFAN